MCSSLYGIYHGHSCQLCNSISNTHTHAWDYSVNSLSDCRMLRSNSADVWDDCRTLHNYIPHSQPLNATDLPIKYIHNSKLFYTGNEIVDEQLAKIMALNHYVHNTDFADRQILYVNKNNNSPKLYSIDHEFSFQPSRICNKYIWNSTYPASEQEQKYIHVYTKTINKIIKEWPPEKIMDLVVLYAEYSGMQKDTEIIHNLLKETARAVEKSHAYAVEIVESYSIKH